MSRGDLHNLASIRGDADVMRYITDHRDEVEAEYRQVLQEADEIRAYWEERNRERLAQVAAMPPKPEHTALWAKLQAQKAAHHDP